MSQKELLEALVRAADRDVAGNEAKHDADIEAELVGDAFVNF
jgi:hypothetical protein